MKYTKTVRIEVDIPELIEGKNSEELYDFITEIDEQYANWDLTVRLYEYFSKQYDDFIAEGIDLKEY